MFFDRLRSTACSASSRTRSGLGDLGKVILTATKASARAFYSICALLPIQKIATRFAIGSITRSIYRVGPTPDYLGDKENMRDIWVHSWPIMRREDRQKRKTEFIRGSYKDFASFMDTARWWMKAPSRFANKLIGMSRRLSHGLSLALTPIP